MYDALYKYLVKYKRLDLAGIGMLVVQRQPAVANFVNHSISAPRCSFVLDNREEVPPERLFSWLASDMQTSEQEAAVRFSDFLLDLNRQLREGKKINWPGIGIFQKQVSGEIRLSPAQRSLPWIDEVTAEKVTRHDAEHTMLVGEKEKTSSEMRRLLLAVGNEKTRAWWVWPVAVMLAILIFLFWHFSENNGPNANGNQVRHAPAEAPSGYNLTP